MRAAVLPTAIAVVLTAQLYAAEFAENFASDPGQRGWATFGEAGLFHWTETGQDLEVTWDSAKPNSYFYRPLGQTLAKNDDVQFRFDLQIDDIAVGLNPDRPFTFELTVGFLNLHDATGTNFWRGTATQSPNLLEFDYFPDSGFGATISPTIISSNNQFATAFSFPLELSAQDLFHIEMAYSAAEQTLSTTVQRNGEPFGPIKQVMLGAAFTDFRLDTLAVSSYSDQGADGSLLAHGRIDNIAVLLPDPPHPSLTLDRDPTGKGWQVTLQSRTNWVYTLERADDLKQWTPAAQSVPGDGGPQVIRVEETDPQGSPPHAFFRVRLERP